MPGEAFLIYFILLLVIPLWAQAKVRSAYKKYSQIATSSQMTGYEVARKILDDNGLFDVTVEEVNGVLTDHYHPSKKAVRLSKGNYRGRSMAAAAVAAHEVGHALQHANGYAFLTFRTALVPLASFGSRSAIWLIIIGFLLSAMNLVLIGIIFMSFAVLFQLVTLPVEFNASTRAMDQLVVSGIIRNDEERATKKVLDAAALTYVAAALVAVAELIRFILMFMASND